MFRRNAAVILSEMASMGRTRGCVKTLVLAIAVLMVIGTANAVEPNTLPPDIGQTLRMVFADISPEGQEQVLIAIRALTPDQAQQAVMNMRSVPRDFSIKLMVLADWIRALLAPADRQRYINGVWGVSRADQMFSEDVHRRILGGMQIPPLGGGEKRPGPLEPGRDELTCSWFTRDTAPPFCAKYFPQ